MQPHVPLIWFSWRMGQMDKANQSSRQQRKMGNGGGKQFWFMCRQKQHNRQETGLDLLWTQERETLSQTGNEGKMAMGEGQPWGAWVLLLPRTLPETQDFWVLLSLLAWGTAKCDRPWFWLLGWLKQQHGVSVLSPCLSGVQLSIGWHKRKNEFAWFDCFFLSPKFEETLHVHNALLKTC